MIYADVAVWDISWTPMLCHESAMLQFLRLKSRSGGGVETIKRRLTLLEVVFQIPKHLAVA